MGAVTPKNKKKRSVFISLLHLSVYPPVLFSIFSRYFCSQFICGCSYHRRALFRKAYMRLITRRSIHALRLRFFFKCKLGLFALTTFLYASWRSIVKVRPVWLSCTIHCIMLYVLMLCAQFLMVSPFMCFQLDTQVIVTMA